MHGTSHCIGTQRHSTGPQALTGGAVEAASITSPSRQLFLELLHTCGGRLWVMSPEDPLFEIEKAQNRLPDMVKLRFGV